MRITVCKLGGSLLSLPDLADRLSRFLQNLDSRPLLVIGGGAAADLVREWDALHDLGQEQSHRLALLAMQLNESLVAELLPGSQVVVDRAGAEACWSRGDSPILNARAFLNSEPCDRIEPLPHHWDVTSDSIAAWVTLCWPADELVLLKSVDFPACSASELAATGLVDAYFPRLAESLPLLSWVNLRAETTGRQWIANPPARTSE